MAEVAQVKRGYLRGVRGLLITPLETSGAMPGTPVNFWIDTAQNVGVTAEIVTGESADLRGGDRLLVRIEEDDVTVGVNLSFTDARFDAKATEIIAGGTLITEAGEGEDPDLTPVGWEAPTVTEQGEDRTPFQAEVYVESFNANGGREGWLKYTFRYCKGNVPNITLGDQEWGTPEFTIDARENPSTGASAYRKEFVDALPAEATPEGEGEGGET